MIFVGLLFSAFFGIFIDRTRQFKKTIKTCMCISAIFACLLMVLLQFNDNEVWIATSILAFGAFSLSIYPISLELGVETTFPVSEVTSTGILILIG